MQHLNLLDTDVVVWLDMTLGEGVHANPLYTQLPVHAEGREVLLSSFDDPLGGAISFVSVLSLPFLLDGLVPQLAAAIDGDPQTVVAAP